MSLPWGYATTAPGNAPADADDGDAWWVTRAQDGDAAAFALLYRRHVARVYAFAARRLDDRAAAEEVTQEVFARALAGLGRCRDGDAFAGWLFAIARHVVSEHHRALRRGGGDLPVAIDAEDPDPTPEERIVQSEAVAELRAARERCLSVRDQELFDLLLVDLTDAEIATALGRRPGAVRTAHWRLLVKLRDCLGIRAGEKGQNRVAH